MKKLFCSSINQFALPEVTFDGVVLQSSDVDHSMALRSSKARAPRSGPQPGGADRCAERRPMRRPAAPAHSGIVFIVDDSFMNTSQTWDRKDLFISGGFE